MSDWTKEETERLIRLKEQDGLSFSIIGERLGRSRNACKNKYARNKDVKVSTSALEEWRVKVDKPSWEEILAHAKQGADLQKKLRPIYIRATRKIDTDKDILLVFASDFHFGSRHVDYDLFLKTADLLKSDDRFYFCVAGPDLETAFTQFRDASAVLNQTIPPFMQIEAYRLWLNEMLPRCVAITSDTHADRRLERNLGDIGILWRDDVPYFRALGILDLIVGDVKYEIVISHQYKGSSIHHRMQPAFRLFRDVYPLADVYCTAHTHSPAYYCGTFFPEARKERQHFVVCGTFKNDYDLYSVRGFGNRGIYGLPTLLLSPKKHRIVFFDDPAIALEVLE